MKKALLALFLAPAAFLNAQVFTSDFETWTSGVPNGWSGTGTNIGAANIIQSTDANGGSSSVNLVNNTTSHKRFSTTAQTVTSATTYDITFWAKGDGQIRTGILVNGNYTYNSYITLTSTWTEYTQSVVASAASSTAEFILSVNNTVAPNNILVDDVTITEGSSSAVTIYDIQYSTAATGESPLLGQIVTVTGVVTGTYVSGTNYGYFLQNGNGAWNGIHVFQGTNSTLPTMGSEVSVTGTVAEYFTLTQITNPVTTVISATGTMPTPVDISSLDLSNQEKYEGVLVRVVDATCTNANSGFGMWEINDGTGPAKVHNLMYTFTPTASAVYTITGVVNYAFDEFRICYRNQNDIVSSSAVTVTPIYDIQYTTAANGNSPLLNSNVTTTGIVTGVRPGQGYFIQSAQGPWNGIFVYNTTSQPAMGDSVVVKGKVVENFSDTEISNITETNIIASGKPLPGFALVTSAQVNTEAYEGVLVRVENAQCTNAAAGFGMFEINDGSGPCKTDDDIYAYVPTNGVYYNVSGPVYYSYSEFKILPRFAADVTIVGGIDEKYLNVISAFPNPSMDVVTVNAPFEINTVKMFDASGVEVLNGTTSTLNVSTLKSGIYFLQVNGLYTEKVQVQH